MPGFAQARGRHVDYGCLSGTPEPPPGALPRCRVKGATDALVLARTGEKPGRTPETGAGPRLLESLDETVREARLLRRYYIRQGSLHGECFCNGLSIPSRTRAPDPRDGRLHRRCQALGGSGRASMPP